MVTLSREELCEVITEFLKEENPEVYDFRVFIEENEWATDWGGGSYNKIIIEYRNKKRSKWKRLYF